MPPLVLDAEAPISQDIQQVVDIEEVGDTREVGPIQGAIRHKQEIMSLATTPKGTMSKSAHVPRSFNCCS